MELKSKDFLVHHLPHSMSVTIIVLFFCFFASVIILTMIGPRYVFFWVVEYEEWKWAKKIIDIGLNGPFGLHIEDKPALL
jgi:hypothetical protein